MKTVTGIVGVLHILLAALWGLGLLDPTPLQSTFTALTAGLMLLVEYARTV